MTKKLLGTKEAVISRRYFLEGTAIASLAAITASLAFIEPAHAKIAQKTVNYQGTPKGSRNCAGCKFFQADKMACEKVKGKISPNGWCSIWRKK
ncbi:unnamed protein product [marine sediment metagenome]|uniref:High potential iron-sulfur proteins family profile domain-containing protein n=1 Tax=marine sediment metagenome TaxID=412755 RepID=X0V0X8_9ZZZZ